MARATTAFLAVLALLPTASASLLWSPSVEPVGAEGLDARFLDHERSDDAPPGFLLQADELRVETDRSRSDAPLLRLGPDTRSSTHHHATVEGTDHGAGGVLAALRLGNATVRVDASSPACGVLTTRGDPYVYEPRLRVRPALYDAAPDALAWEGCAPAGLTVVGDIVLVLWAWDATLRSDEGAASLHAGPVAAGDALAGENATELFLFARNATLTLPAAPGAIHVADARLRAQGLRLSDASGRVGGVEVSGDVSLAGDLDLRVRGQGSMRPVAVTVAGDVRSITLDDHTVAPSGPGSILWWPWLLGVVVVAGLARVRPHIRYTLTELRGGDLGSLVPQTVRQRRAVGLWLLAVAAGDRGHHRTSLRRANRAHELFRPFVEAQMTRAVAAGRLGRFADAMTDFVDLFHRCDQPRDRAEAACGVAEQCCRLRRWPQAKEWLLLAVMEAFPYVHYRSLDPVFDHFRGEPWFDALRNGPTQRAGDPAADPSVQ